MTTMSSRLGGVKVARDGDATNEKGGTGSRSEVRTSARAKNKKKAKKSPRPRADYAIGAVDNAFRLLDAFHGEGEIGVAELARRLELHKNNVFRLLATLQGWGYIEQNASSERYRLGLACHRLGQSCVRWNPVLQRSGPTLERLLEETGETVHLAVRDAFEVVHLDGRAPAREIAARLRVGRCAPLHCTALGKVLLGCSPERVWREYDERFAARGRLPRRTERSIEDPAKFFEQLRTAAGSGWAIEVGEFEDGLGCAAAPVYSASGEVAGALSVSAPLFRADESRLAGDLRRSVVAAADALSASLGYEG